MTVQTLKEYLCCLPTGAVVTGHAAPDTDAVISALFEAYRLTLSGTPAVPMIQDGIPRETAWLLGELADLVPVGEVPNHLPLVLTDHHDVDRYPNPITAIADHHPVSADTPLDGIDAEIKPVGAATTLVACRIQKDGITPDSTCARILLGAILLDTEGLSSRKAKTEDVETAKWLYSLCGENPRELFSALQEQLLSEEDVTTLYRRDYRRYTDPEGNLRLGWAILKVWADACPDLADVRRLLAEDTAPTRVAKIVLNNREKGNRTEYYLAGGEEAEAMLTLVQTMGGETARRTADDTVFLPEDAQHWGRKRYVAMLEESWRKKS